MRIEEPPFWRLGRPIRRVFTPASSYFSYAVIFLGLLAISLFTLFTKVANFLSQFPIPYNQLPTPFLPFLNILNILDIPNSLNSHDS